MSIDKVMKTNEFLTHQVTSLDLKIRQKNPNLKSMDQTNNRLAKEVLVKSSLQSTTTFPSIKTSDILDKLKTQEIELKD